ncbi:MAG: hypothetical protein ACE37K_16705 [Planctomycetota bacterium]|jgi:hypothetical protein
MNSSAITVRAAFAGLTLTAALAAQCPSYQPFVPAPSGQGGVSGPAGPVAPNPTSPRPSQPSTPAAPAPATPRPTGGPTTGGPARPSTPRGPVGGAAPGRTAPRGFPISFERGATSKDRLKVDWLHPVPPKAEAGEGTRAAGPLPLNAALKILWENDDGRPLLVLRECTKCEGTDAALLSRSLKNDKTMLLTKWFRTVRLPAHITEYGHPFHMVFRGYRTFDKGWPHFFLLADKDSRPVVFDGKQTQSKLWKGMYDVLEERYAKNPEKAVKKWLSLLDRYDALDARRVQLREELLKVRAEKGPDSSKAKKLAKKLAEIEKDKEKVAAAEKKVRDLGLMKQAADKKKVAAK